MAQQQSNKKTSVLSVQQSECMISSEEGKIHLTSVLLVSQLPVQLKIGVTPPQQQYEEKACREASDQGQ